MTAPLTAKEKREKELEERTKLIQKAKAGDEKAQQVLSEPPYNLRVFTEDEIQAVEGRPAKRAKKSKKVKKGG